MKILVLPDIHGRRFWKAPCEHAERYDKIVFLGDYLDPYAFEGIEVSDAFSNFKEIVAFKKRHSDKVVLLLGNHDMPYFSPDYFAFSSYHCRHSMMYHDAISKVFYKNRSLFQLAYAADGVLFTHAGVESGWLEHVVGCNSSDIEVICRTLNDLLTSPTGLLKLYYVTIERGGSDEYGSCIWADIHDLIRDKANAIGGDNENPILRIRQVFGHTLQTDYDENLDIVFGEAVEFANCKMLDTAKAYVLDTADFRTTNETNDTKA